MSSCKHGGSTNCEQCRKKAHFAYLLYSPATFKYMRERIAQLEKALKSIAINTCCDKCQEAARVAREALQEQDNAKD
jgi:bacterioferritin-associated ferredoxin